MCGLSSILSLFHNKFKFNNTRAQILDSIYQLTLRIILNLTFGLKHIFVIIFTQHCYGCQGSHRLEKYLNLEGFLQKSLKIKSALNSTGKLLEGLESPSFLLFSVGLNIVDRDLNQYKIVVPLFCATNASPNKSTTISCSFSSTNFSIISV